MPRRRRRRRKAQCPRIARCSGIAQSSAVPPSPRGSTGVSRPGPLFRALRLAPHKAGHGRRLVRPPQPRHGEVGGRSGQVVILSFGGGGRLTSGDECFARRLTSTLGAAAAPVVTPSYPFPGLPEDDGEDPGYSPGWRRGPRSPGSSPSGRRPAAAGAWAFRTLPACRTGRVRRSWPRGPHPAAPAARPARAPWWP